MGEDLSLFLADVGVCAVLVAVLDFVRRTLSSAAWRTFLGITMTFIVRTGGGYVMMAVASAVG